MMVGTGTGRSTRPLLALPMVRRLSLVMVLTGVLVHLLTGVAFASESRVLDQATCEDPNPWDGGSEINDGVWDGVSATCSGDWAAVEHGDQLTIPAGVTLVLAGSLQVLDGGVVTNHGSIRVEDLWVVEGSSRLYNHGSIVAGSDVDDNLVSGSVNVHEESEVDNFGTVRTYFFSLEEDSTFLIRCGASLDASVMDQYGQDPTYEECPPDDDEPDPPIPPPPAPPSIVVAPVETTTTTTTTELVTTTTVLEVLELQVVAEPETLPETGVDDASSQGLLAFALVVAGLALLASTAHVKRSED